MSTKTEENKNFWLFPHREYYIDKPELYFYYKYESLLNNKKMLDIGIGFGRTTNYFAEVAKEYIGVDIQRESIDFCSQKFKHLTNSKFYVIDARNMEMFDDNSFDFILFSFNGIDYVSHNDRLLILKEIIRVGKNNCIFYFSSKNLQFIEELYSLKYSINHYPSILFPFAFLFSVRRKILLRIYNPEIGNIIRNVPNLEYAYIHDGPHGYKFNCYCITPEKQIEQLNKLGYKNIKVISLRDGLEIKSKSEFGAIKDYWIYYLCQISK